MVSVGVMSHGVCVCGGVMSHGGWEGRVMDSVCGGVMSHGVCVGGS